MKYGKVILCFIGIILLGGCKSRDDSSEISGIAYHANSIATYTIKKNVECECKIMMEQVKEIYSQADKGAASNVELTEESIGEIMTKLAKTGYPVFAGKTAFNMENYNEFQDFLAASKENKPGKIVIYEILLNGGLQRSQFIFDGMDMSVLETIAMWNEENQPGVIITSHHKLNKWELTEKGWFIFEYCIPEADKVTEVINGYVMIRVKPLKPEYIEMTQKYLIPICYQGNNLFSSSWDAQNMEGIDYNGLFEYLRSIKNSEPFNGKIYEQGIPKIEFENLFIEYLPVTSSQLEVYSVYDEVNKVYPWQQLGCGNYAPNAFGTSIPEITQIVVNEDGTITLKIDAICEMLGTDQLFSHELTLSETKEEGIRYLKNTIIQTKEQYIPEYQYRIP